MAGPTLGRGIFAFPLLALILVQCGSHGVTTTPVALPASATATAVVATAGGFAVRLPATSVVSSGVFTFPAPTSGGAVATMTATVQSTAPGTVPAVATARKRNALDATGTTTIAYVSFESSLGMTFTEAPTLVITLPAADITPGSSFELAYFDPSLDAWNLTWSGPATLRGTTLTFASNGGPFALTANVAAEFAVLQTTSSPTPSASPTPSPSASPTASPSPTPSPSPSPSPSPTPSPGPIALTPTDVQLVIGATPSSQTLTVSQSGVRPTFTPTMTCTIGANSGPGTVADISAVGSTSPSTVGGSVQFSVSLDGTSPTAGTCSGSIASSAGGTPAAFTVEVTQTDLSIQARGRR